MLALALVAVIVSHWMGGLLGKAPGDWFQRSGSILTAAAAWSFAWNESSKRRVWSPSNQFESEEYSKLYSTLEPYFSFLGRASVVLTIVGTIIWGYGDLILQFVMDCSGKSEM